MLLAIPCHTLILGRHCQHCSGHSRHQSVGPGRDGWADLLVCLQQASIQCIEFPRQRFEFTTIALGTALESGVELRRSTVVLQHQAIGLGHPFVVVQHRLARERMPHLVQQRSNHHADRLLLTSNERARMSQGTVVDFDLSWTQI